MNKFRLVLKHIYLSYPESNIKMSVFLSAQQVTDFTALFVQLADGKEFAPLYFITAILDAVLEDRVQVCAE